MAITDSQAREAASRVVGYLEPLSSYLAKAVDDAEHTHQRPPSVLSQAYIADALATAEAIADGTISSPQPRLSECLLLAVAELDKTDHNVLAWECIGALRVAARAGISANASQPTKEFRSWSRNG